MKTTEHMIPVVYGDCRNDSEVDNAGLRDFYDEAPELSVVMLEDLIEEQFSVEPLDVYVPNSNIAEVCQWLADPKVYVAFKPQVLVNERGLSMLRLTK